MKKSFAIIALAALVMLAGCKKNDPQPNGTRLIAGIEKHKSDSKTLLDGLQIKWSEGDQLYVNNGTNSAACFTLTSNPGATSGEFATTGEYSFAAENNVAVYPYNYVSGLDNTTVTMTLPAVQAASGAGSFGNGANPMLGTFSDMDNLTLTSLCGVLCLQLTGDNVAITAIEIVGGPDDKLNGTFTVDYMNPVLTYSANGTNTVRLNFTETDTLTSTAQKFYVVVPAGTLHGFTMKVYNGTNEIFSKSTANNVPVSVNTLSTMLPVEVVPAPAGPPALTMEASTAGTIVVNNPKSGMQYSLNGGAKAPVTSDAINVSASDKVAFYGNGTSINNYDGTTIAGGTAQVMVYGSIMSLIDETGYATLTTLPNQDYVFYGLFSGNTKLTDASGLLLPATTLANGCYFSMFSGCTSLTAAPTLPATTLANNCYYSMFSGCTSLTTAPALPATTLTLAEGCYANMFSGCTSLTAAPTLPAETLASECYSGMFSGTSLTTAPELPATTLAESCYYEMFSGCTSLTTAPALPATELAGGCYSYMFSGCTNLTTAPTLSATTLAESCCSYMFQNCTSLVTASTTLPVTTLAEFCYSGMFKGCTNLTTAPTLPAPALAGGCYSYMFSGCTSLNNITCLATSGINSNSSTSDWVNGVASTGTFTKASGATGWWTGNNGIPSGWTVNEQ